MIWVNHTGYTFNMTLWSNIQMKGPTLLWYQGCLTKILCQRLIVNTQNVSKLTILCMHNAFSSSIWPRKYSSVALPSVCPIKNNCPWALKSCIHQKHQYCVHMIIGRSWAVLFIFTVTPEEGPWPKALETSKPMQRNTSTSISYDLYSFIVL